MQFSYFLFIDKHVRIPDTHKANENQSDEYTNTQELFWSSDPIYLSKTSKDFAIQPIISQINYITNYFDGCCDNSSSLSGYCTADKGAVCSDKKLSNCCTCAIKDTIDEDGCCQNHYGISNYCYQGRIICNDGKLSPKCRCMQ